MCIDNDEKPSPIDPGLAYSIFFALCFIFWKQANEQREQFAEFVSLAVKMLQENRDDSRFQLGIAIILGNFASNDHEHHLFIRSFNVNHILCEAILKHAKRPEKYSEILQLFSRNGWKLLASNPGRIHTGNITWIFSQRTWETTHTVFENAFGLTHSCKIIDVCIEIVVPSNVNLVQCTYIFGNIVFIDSDHLPKVKQPAKFRTNLVLLLRIGVFLVSTKNCRNLIALPARDLVYHCFCLWCKNEMCQSGF